MVMSHLMLRALMVDFQKVATIEFTNASGYKENYDIYKSDNANLGNTTILLNN